MGTSLAEPAGRYTGVAAALHWSVAVLIAANVLLGLVAPALPDSWVRPAIDLHKSIGLTVLALVILRVLWRLSHRPPPLPASYPRLERAAARTAHGVLYGLMVLLPVSGWLHDSAFKDAAANPLRIFWLVPWFRIGAVANLDPTSKELLHNRFFTMHAWSAYALIAVVALHVLGALKHQYVDGHSEFQRMRAGRLPGG